MKENNLGSKFYGFSVILWDYLIGNALFLLFNIPIPLVILFLKPKDSLPGPIKTMVLLLMIAIASLNVLPSFIALKYTYAKKDHDHDSVVKLFWQGYKQAFPEAIKASLLYVLLFFVFYFDYLYFSLRENHFIALVFAIAMLITAFFTMAYAIIHSRFNFTFKQTFQLSIMYFGRLTRPVLSSLAFLFAFTWMFNSGFRIIIWLMFASVARISNNLSQDVEQEIYRRHTDEGLKADE